MTDPKDDPKASYDLTPPNAAPAAEQSSGAERPSVEPTPQAPATDPIDITIEPEPVTPEAPRVTPASGAAKPAPAPAAPKRPLVRTNRIEWPLAVAGCCAALFVAACLSGQQGIFPRAEGVDIGYWDRFVMLLRGLLMMLLSGGCMVAGAALFHLVDGRPLGDLRALAARMLMISSVALLARVAPIDIVFLKQTYDVLAPVGVAWVLMILLFRLSPRDAGTVIGGGILSLIVLGFGSTIVSFAIWAGSAAGAAATP